MYNVIDIIFETLNFKNIYEIVRNKLNYILATIWSKIFIAKHANKKKNKIQLCGNCVLLMLAYYWQAEQNWADEVRVFSSTLSKLQNSSKDENFRNKVLKKQCLERNRNSKEVFVLVITSCDGDAEHIVISTSPFLSFVLK